MAREFVAWDLSGPSRVRERIQHHCWLLLETHTTMTHVPLVVTLPGAVLRGELYCPSELFVRPMEPSLVWQCLRIYSELVLPEPTCRRLLRETGGSLTRLVQELITSFKASEWN